MRQINFSRDSDLSTPRFHPATCGNLGRGKFRITCGRHSGLVLAVLGERDVPRQGHPVQFRHLSSLRCWGYNAFDPPLGRLRRCSSHISKWNTFVQSSHPPQRNNIYGVQHGITPGGRGITSATKILLQRITAVPIAITGHILRVERWCTRDSQGMPVVEAGRWRTAMNAVPRRRRKTNGKLYTAR